MVISCVSEFMDSIFLFASSASILLNRIFRAVFFPEALEVEYTTFALRTHICSTWGTSFSSWDDPGRCEVMMDFEDPDLDIVATSVAARHSELLGLPFGNKVLHEICHLNRVTDDARTL